MLKVDDELDQVTVAKVYEAEQEHVFRFWGQLSTEQRRALLEQLRSFDLQLLGRLVRKLEPVARSEGVFEPVPPQRFAPERRAELEALGWEALAAGKVACLVVAGGQGTRLGWPHPKGTYPVGPVSGKSLFRLFAEQLRATARRAGTAPDLYVLTSAQNRAETEAYFAQHDRFGLEPERLFFLTQAELPNTDARGKLLLAEKHRVATSPDGHGGAFLALQRAGALERMAERGQELLFYWQVDNPLCRVADPAFLGAHLAAAAEASTKVVEKEEPEEKVGLLVQREGQTRVVEYSELDPALQAERDPRGRLRYRAGNTAIHLFSRSFLARLANERFRLDYHVARKAIPCVDDDGKPVQPREPNGIKFEAFIFDLLPQARGHVAFAIDREEEFEPLKNAEGPCSPESVRRALSERARRWLLEAGFAPRPEVTYEVSPLRALDPTELAQRLEALPEPQEGRVAIE